MRYLLETSLVMLVALGPSLAAAERFAHPVPMEERKSGNFYVQGALGGGVETDFLVDTGSGYVSLSKATFQHIKSKPGTVYLRDIIGSMANGKVMKVPIYRVAELSLGEDCVLANVEVAVFPQAARDILGLSALRRVEPFAMQLSPPMLFVSDCGPQQPAVAALSR
jgi:predicted aspartyl protease